MLLPLGSLATWPPDPIIVAPNMYTSLVSDMAVPLINKVGSFMLYHMHP